MKKIIAAALAAMAFTGVSAYAKTIQVTIDSQDVYVQENGIKKTTLDVVAYIENDITMIPLRFVSETLGADVQWNHDTKEVTVTSGEKSVVVKIGDINAYSYINGESTVSALNAAPVIVNDFTLVPLRFVSENLGANVEYVAPTCQVLITDEVPAMYIGSLPVYNETFRTYYLTNYGASVYYGEEIYEQMVYNDVLTLSAINSVWSVIDPNESLAEETLANVNSVTDEELASEGILKASLVKTLQLMENANNAFEMLADSVSAEEINAYYNENYICAKHVLLSTEDSETGEEMDETEKKKVLSEAQSVLRRAKSGTDFDKLIEEFGEDPGMEAYPEGYVFTTGEMVEEFEIAAFELEDGKVSDIVETVYGYHIIKKLPLPEISEDVSSQISYMIANDTLQQIINSAPVTINTSQEEICEYMSAPVEGVIE